MDVTRIGRAGLFVELNESGVLENLGQAEDAVERSAQIVAQAGQHALTGRACGHELGGQGFDLHFEMGAQGMDDCDIAQRRATASKRPKNETTGHGGPVFAPQLSFARKRLMPDEGAAQALGVRQSIPGEQAQDVSAHQLVLVFALEPENAQRGEVAVSDRQGMGREIEIKEKDGCKALFEDRIKQADARGAHLGLRDVERFETNGIIL